MSWVIATAVEPSRLTQSTISPSMIAPMIGSRPVVGSSKNMMSGLGGDGARQGHALLHPAGQFRRGQLADARRRGRPRPGTRRPPARACARGRACVLRQQAEGHVLPDRQAVEQRAVLEQHADPRARRVAFGARHGGRCRGRRSRSLPASGSIRPRMHFSSTDLPEPEPPITTIEVRGMTSRSMPSSTTLSPKRLCRLRRRIFGVVSVMRRVMPWCGAV